MRSLAALLVFACTTISPFRFLGKQEFILRNTARAEQHLYADDANRIVWIQREAFLPGVEGTYDYGEDPITRIDGLEFHVNVRQYTAPPDPDSDRARAFALLRTKGIELGIPATRVRFVHVLDATRRSELMIIYAEPGMQDEKAIVERGRRVVERMMRSGRT